MVIAAAGVPVRPARDVCLESEVLLGGMSIELPGALTETNLGEFDPLFANSGIADAFKARRPDGFDVELCRLPPQTLLHGGGRFMMTSRGVEILEQVPPALAHAPDLRLEILNTPRPVQEITAPCVIVARFGEGTWGHWLGELLPRAALAEYFRPGAFRYVVPAWMSRRGAAGGLGTAALDSLAAFGIGEDRLIRVEPEPDYHLTNARLVAPVWFDHIPHPAALDLLRAIPPLADTVLLPRKLAVIRVSPDRRLENIAELLPVLARHGYVGVPVGALPFDEQVAMFRHATHVFATLGSDLTGLMFSPDGVRVLAAAPETWTDRFFYGLCQLRHGSYAELRGPVASRNEAMLRSSGFIIDPLRLDGLLARLA